jgi:hypothetical protein
MPSKQNEGFRMLEEFVCQAIVDPWVSIPRHRTVTLYRPVGPKELELIKKSMWREFPPRLAGQPMFYPVLNEDYAAQIARDWNVKESGAGYVTRFLLDANFAERYPIQMVGTSMHQELWVPAEEIAELNRHIVGPIEVIAHFQ